MTQPEAAHDDSPRPAASSGEDAKSEPAQRREGPGVLAVAFLGVALVIWAARTMEIPLDQIGPLPPTENSAIQRFHGKIVSGPHYGDRGDPVAPVTPAEIMRIQDPTPAPAPPATTKAVPALGPSVPVTAPRGLPVAPGIDEVGRPAPGFEGTAPAKPPVPEAPAPEVAPAVATPETTAGAGQ